MHITGACCVSYASSVPRETTVKPLTCVPVCWLLCTLVMSAPLFAGFTLEDNLVCTVGSAAIWPGASNVIPGSANFTIDIRCRANGVRESIVADVTAGIEALCGR